MHKLRRFYYKNKVKIWKTIAILAFFFIILQIINTIISKDNEKKINNSSINTSNNIIQEEKNNVEIISNSSGVTGEIIEQETLNKEINIIDKFIEYCNNKEIEKAYDLISKECKDELYKNLNSFEQNYYNPIFSDGIKKIAQIENWMQNIYKVNYANDILITGKVEDKTILDYITIVKEEEELKLNINSFIKKEKIEKNQNTNNIQIKVLNRKVFMNYEEYTIQIENKTDKTILMDTGESTKSIYIEDKNNVKYYSHSHEILRGLLKIDSGFSTQINIKFTKNYNNEIENGNRIVFSNVIFDYNEYIKGNKEMNVIYIEL